MASKNDETMTEDKFLELCATSSFNTRNQSCDIHDGELFYGFRYNLAGKEYDAYVFSDGRVIGGDMALPFIARSRLVYSQSQLSSHVLPEWRNNAVDKVNGRKLFRDIVAFLKEFIELKNDEEYEVIVLWIFHTYLKYQFGVTPYIHLNGQAGSGKSTLMRFCSLIAFKGWFVVKPSPASLFRFIDSNMCSTFFDEFESYTPNEKGDVFSVLNDGYVRDGTIPRVRNNPDGTCNVDIFKPFGAKMFSSVTDVRFDTFTSRCIELYIMRTNRVLKDMVPLSTEDALKFQCLRDSLYIWHLQNWKSVMQSYRAVAMEGVTGRALQIAKPIMAYAIEFGIKDKVLDFFSRTITERADNDLEFDRDFLLMKVVYVSVILEGKHMLTPECIVDRYAMVIKNQLGVVQDKFLPNKRTVGWKLRKIDACKKKRSKEGIFYEFNPVLLIDRIKRYGYEVLLEDKPMIEVNPVEIVQEEVR